MTRRNGHRDPVPADASPFHVVAEAIKTQGRVTGWEQARDIILDQFPVFQDEMGTYQALKAALEVDRHAMFADVQQQAKDGRFKAEVWEKFQQFLHGEIDEVPVVRPNTTQPSRVPGVDMEDEDGDEE